MKKIITIWKRETMKMSTFKKVLFCMVRLEKTSRKTTLFQWFLLVLPRIFNDFPKKSFYVFRKCMNFHSFSKNFQIFTWIFQGFSKNITFSNVSVFTLSNFLVTGKNSNMCENALVEILPRDISMWIFWNGKYFLNAIVMVVGKYFQVPDCRNYKRL